ncbi:MAG: hypothetical protein HQK49_19125 [Oligoflexia bacterium]|nr:hypothetical protein [Oligoflexia bacterium]
MTTKKENKNTKEKDASKNKTTKKLKSKKLEERIAPGMLGGGVVDPGAIENVDSTPENNYNSNSGDVSGTNIDPSTTSSNYSGQNSGYVDENYNNQSGPTNTNPQYDSYQNNNPDGSSDYNNNSNYGNDEFANSQNQTDGDFVQEQPTWQEPDWVTPNADGSIHVTPPEGVSIDPTQGIANFSPEIVNEALPIPEDMTIKTDGSLDINMPQGTQYNPDTNALTMPADTVKIDEIPQEMNPVQNPDGSINMTLPPDGGMNYDPQTNTLNMNNYYANELAPDNININENGSVDVKLPDDGVTYNQDGSIDISADAKNFMDNPPPEYVQDVAFADYQPNGSVTFDPPQGMEVDGGIMTVPNDMLNQLPIDENFTVNPDGTANYALPEGTQYNQDANALTLPQGEVYMNQIPEGIDAHVNPDQTITAYLPEGVQYNADANAVQMDNYWANQVTPDQVNINTDGSVSVALPTETQYYQDGSFNIPPQQVDFLDHPAPDYVHDVPFGEYVGDGNYHFDPPENIQIDPEAGTMYVPPEALNTIPIPEDFTLNTDGTLDIKVPEGTQFNPDMGMLTFPQGTVPIADLPEGVNPILNPDGTVSATLADGMNYNPQTFSVHMDNYWANEMAPEAVEISPQGGLTITLPDETKFHTDGSFTIPSGSADFLNDSPPPYVMDGPDWVSANPDGSVTFDKPDYVNVNPDQGMMTMNYDSMAQNFQNYIPPEVHFTPQGTMNVDVPQGTVYNPDMSMLTFPAGEVHTNEIPPVIESTLNPDGTVSVKLPYGMDFDPQNMQVKLDNYWTNEVTPPAVEFQPNGQVTIDLPPTTQYFPNGDFTIPADSANFIDNPPPPYVMNGPDWISPNPDGSMTFEKQDGWQVNPDQGQMTMNYDYMNQNFENYIKPDVHFNPDGTMNVDVPASAVYNAEANTLTLPSKDGHPDDVPEALQPTINPDGTITIHLSDGMNFDTQAGQLKFDNYWTNELTPPAVEFQPNGQVYIDLPPNTQYFPQGDFTVPHDYVNFIDNPIPPYVNDGPDWAQTDANGAVTVNIPENVNIDVSPANGTMTMDFATATSEFKDLIPPDLTINPDGSADIKVPTGTLYDTTANTLTFPAGTMHLNEIPEGVNATYNPNGTITATMPEGMQYNPQVGSVHMSNEWLNNMAPDPINITSSGMVTITLPPGTQYFNNGDSFVIPADQANFMEANPMPSPGPSGQFSGDPNYQSGTGTATGGYQKVG